MKNIFGVLLFLTSAQVFSQVVGIKKNWFQDRFCFQWVAGVHTSPLLRDNDYTLNANLTLGPSAYLLIKKHHLIGIRIEARGTDIEEDEIKEAFDKGTPHMELMNNTKGYNNTYQLGLAYRNVLSFENGFTLLPSIDFGLMWSNKESHRVQFKSTTNEYHTIKTIGVHPADGNYGLGYYVSGKMGIGYKWKYTGFTLFGECEYLYGEAQQENVYYEDWADTDKYETIHYTEDNVFNFLSVKVGFIMHPWNL